MFGDFEKNKTRYESGQVFPFLIAILCVVIIMIMITVNLGQIGMFKTEVSNAADAGALAGVSVLSSGLLGFGLRSESMCGDAQGTILSILIALAFWWLFGLGIIAAILIYIAYIFRMMTQMQQALGEARLAWTNAKKTALQFAFSNIGVDEHKPTFEEFVQSAYGFDPKRLSPDGIKKLYGYYYRGVDDDNPGRDLRPFLQTGFSRFMQDINHGYWHFGKIEPRMSSRVILHSGYGWSETGRNNSYDDCCQGCAAPHPYTKNTAYCSDPEPYSKYANWIEVQVTGTTMYGLDFFSWFEVILTCILGFLTDAITIPWFFEWMDDAKDWIMHTLLFWAFNPARMMRYMFPMGIELMNGTKSDYDNQVNNNFLSVKVIRHKGKKDLGLWNFRYDDASGTAVAHAFQEHPGGRSPETFGGNDGVNLQSETIRPVFMEGFIMFLACITQVIKGYKDKKGLNFLGSNDEHLFETELTNVF